MNETSRCRWIDMAVLPRFSWPNEPLILPFEDQLIHLSPKTEGLTYRVSLLSMEQHSLPIGASLLNRFLSSLAWSLESGIESLWIMGSNHPNRPGLMGSFTKRLNGMADIKPWTHLYLPEVKTDEQQLSLALYREGMNMVSPLYSVLSFFKILNIKFATGMQHKTWITNAIPALAGDQQLNEWIGELHISEPLDAHLWEKCRCAVAHANSSPIVNPDDYASVYRMDIEARILQRLAEHFMETELGLMSSRKAFQLAQNIYVPVAVSREKPAAITQYHLHPSAFTS